MMKLILTFIFFSTAFTLHAGILQRGKVQLICHRTANRDMPENTLESLALAARMGCNIVEVDVRTTLDGQLVLNHDGYLERLTDGMGDVSSTSFDELQLLDYGGWMADRFAPMRIPRFTDALRLARELGIGLDLDIKEKGEGATIYGALRSEGMLERVIFNGDDGNAAELEALYPNANRDAVVWLGPECNATQVDALHAKGQFVVANFSANAHEMDMPAMRAAVAAGVDAINVDYPLLGADAVGRPVEAKLATLAEAARHGTIAHRVASILELSQYTGFHTQSLFAQLLRDPEQQVSHAAALALVMARPVVPPALFIEALSAPETSARTSAAWALGITHAQAAASLLPLLKDHDPMEVEQVLLALSRCLGGVPAQALLPFLGNDVPTIRGAAALALARHHPEIAATVIPQLLHREEQRSASAYSSYVQRGRPKLSQAEIDPIVEDYREHMKLVHAIELLDEKDALPLLAMEAFRSAEDPSHVTSVLAGYGLWDRIAVNPSLAIQALDSSDIEVADRAEWTLVKADDSVLPSIRAAIRPSSTTARPRLIHILAWHGDASAVPILHRLQQTDPQDGYLLKWALEKISEIHFGDE